MDIRLFDSKCTDRINNKRNPYFKGVPYSIANFRREIR